jgi:hypothetical protein
MPGLVPVIHDFRKDVDGRDKPGHDVESVRRSSKGP